MIFNFVFRANVAIANICKDFLFPSPTSPGNQFFVWVVFEFFFWIYFDLNISPSKLYVLVIEFSLERIIGLTDSGAVANAKKVRCLESKREPPWGQRRKYEMSAAITNLDERLGRGREAGVKGRDGKKLYSPPFTFLSKR